MSRLTKRRQQMRQVGLKCIIYLDLGTPPSIIMTLSKCSALIGQYAGAVLTSVSEQLITDGCQKGFAE